MRAPAAKIFALTRSGGRCAFWLTGQPHRARRVLEQFSDMTTEPIDSAAGMKGAYGAVPNPAHDRGAAG